MDHLTGNVRLSHLDGIRGIASVLVVLCHLSCVFFPSFYKSSPLGGGLSQIFLNSPLNVLTNGHSAVQCFFVLSGYLIARKVYLKQESAILSPVLQYTKLLKIVLPAVLLAATLMCFGLLMHLKAVDLDPTLAFVYDYNNFAPSLRGIFTDVFYWTFKSRSSYVGPLWTIHIEFVGSLLIAPIAFFASKKPDLAKCFYLVICFVLFKLSANKEFVPFVLGALAFDCSCNFERDSSFLGKITYYILSHKWTRMLLLLLGLYSACANSHLTGWYLPLGIVNKIFGNANFFVACGISACLATLDFFPEIKSFLSIKPLRWLGSISAYVYAFHWQIILSVGCGMFILFYGKMPYWENVAIVSIIVFIVTCFVAWGYGWINVNIIEKLSIKLNKLKEIWRQANA